MTKPIGRLVAEGAAISWRNAEGGLTQRDEGSHHEHGNVDRFRRIENRRRHERAVLGECKRGIAPATMVWTPYRVARSESRMTFWPLIIRIVLAMKAGETCSFAGDIADSPFRIRPLL
jgi:hypothetical protein